MHALIIGATGATGKDLMNLLLTDPTFDRIDIFVRRNIDLQHAKLKTHLIDFDHPEQWKHLVQGDVLFSALGTTLKAAGSKEAQWKIDYEYQYQFAKAARENNVANLVLVSAGMASPKSMFYYSRMKGKLEVAVKALNFQKLDIFNPPLLIRKNTDRGGEITALKTLKYLNKIGLFSSQKPLPTEVLAQSMINVAKTKNTGVFTYHPRAIWEQANKAPGF
jgi:uncharacterized protein YbjT (DUF2867 family)